MKVKYLAGFFVALLGCALTTAQFFDVHCTTDLMPLTPCFQIPTSSNSVQAYCNGDCISRLRTYYEACGGDSTFLNNVCNYGQNCSAELMRVIITCLQFPAQLSASGESCSGECANSARRYNQRCGGYSTAFVAACGGSLKISAVPAMVTLITALAKALV